MTKFDSADVEAERRSDKIFETLNVFARAEIAKGKVYRDDSKGVSDDVARCLERRCRAWYASTPKVKQAEAFEQDTARGAILSAEVDRTGAALKALSGGGPMGLTPDAAKTPEWHAAKRAYNKAFAALRAFNANYVKQFKAELRAARRAR